MANLIISPLIFGNEKFKRLKPRQQAIFWRLAVLSAHEVAWVWLEKGRDVKALVDAGLVEICGQHIELASDLVKEKNKKDKLRKRRTPKKMPPHSLGLPERDGYFYD